MAKLKVYRFKKYVGEADDYFVSTRMATREWIKSSNAVELMEGTETEIDSDQLVPGESWTEVNFVPKTSN
jgi:hypothetical protein